MQQNHGQWKNIQNYFAFLLYFNFKGVTLAQLVKLLSCDCKVTGSSPGNSLLCKNRVRLRTIHQMVGPLPGPCVCGSFSAPGCPFIVFQFQFSHLLLMKIVKGVHKKGKILKQHDDRSVVKHMIKRRIVLYYFFIIFFFLSMFFQQQW